MDGPTPLSPEAITSQLVTVADWTHQDNRIRRNYTFATFAEAFGFMAEIAIVADGMNHHPEWTNVWNRVEVALTTHDVDGLSESDFVLARRMDVVAAARS